MKKLLIISTLAISAFLSSPANAQEEVKQVTVVKDYSDTLSDLSARITALEEENRRLYGRIENLEYRSRSSKDAKNSPHMQDRGDYYVSKPGDVDSEYVIRVPKEVAEREKAERKSEVFEKAPTGEEAEFNDAFAKLGKVDYVGARKGFEDFIRRNPDSDYTHRSLFWLGEIDFLEGKYKDAAVNYLKAYKKYPKGKRAGESLIKTARSLQKLNKPIDACKNIEKFKEEFPNEHPTLKRSANKTAIELRCQ